MNNNEEVIREAELTDTELTDKAIQAETDMQEAHAKIDNLEKETGNEEEIAGLRELIENRLGVLNDIQQVRDMVGDATENPEKYTA